MKTAVWFILILGLFFLAGCRHQKNLVDVNDLKDEQVFHKRDLVVAFSSDVEAFTKRPWSDIALQFRPYLNLKAVTGRVTDADICVAFITNVGEVCGRAAAGCVWYGTEFAPTTESGWVPTEDWWVTPDCRGRVGVYVDVYRSPRVITNIVIHELLHAVGLPQHNDEEDSILYPFISEHTVLSLRDRQRLSAIYSSVSVYDPPVP